MKEDFEFTADNASEDLLKVLANRLLVTLKWKLGCKDSPDKQQRYMATLEIKRI